jgi:hypothetical protein
MKHRRTYQPPIMPTREEVKKAEVLAIVAGCAGVVALTLFLLSIGVVL